MECWKVEIEDLKKYFPDEKGFSENCSYYIEKKVGE